MKKSIAMLLTLALLLVLPTLAMATEIGELPAETPVPVVAEPVEEAAEEPKEDTHLPITEVVIPGTPVTTMADLEYELDAGILDADGNWLYSTGDTASWHNVPEGYKVGYRLRISNYGPAPFDVSVTETVDGEEHDRGTVTIDSMHRHSFWRYYGTPQDSIREVSFKVNGEEVMAKTINFTLAGVPENLEITLATCELDADENWVQDFEDNVSRSQITDGNQWGYVLHVWNNGTESVTLQIYDVLNTKVYPWSEAVVEPGKGMYFPCALQENVSGERDVYYTINGEKVAEKTFVFLQE